MIHGGWQTAAQASGEGAPSFKRAAQLFQEAEEMSAGAAPVAVANGGYYQARFPIVNCYHYPPLGIVDHHLL